MANRLMTWLGNFLKPPQGAQIDIKRRHIVAAGVAGLGGGLLFQAQPPALRRNLNPAFIRPPGAVADEAFLGKCIRCGECMKVCPTNAIQPALLEMGLDGMWSPLLKMRLGYCEYQCNMCTTVCPTEAIAKLTLEKKQKTKIGLSVVEKDRCLPYAYGTNCQRCYDQCPLPDKAISMVESTVAVGSRMLRIKQPQVNSKLCTGCGVCENKCPVDGQAAIRVVSI